MEHALVVCYSHTGVSLRLADLLCSHTGWPMGVVTDERPRSGASGTLRCIADSLLRRQPAIRYEGPDPSNFRTVVLVSPVWMRGLSGPMRTFVAQYARRLHRVAVIVTMNTGGWENVVAEIAARTGPAPYVSANAMVKAAFTSKEIEADGFGGRLEEFARRLQPGAAMPSRAPAPFVAIHPGESAGT
ncbi:flavodoxin family protein [Caenimonas aquaedulcis]|uniref:Flavodoxin n=1 Tax=Caenimonas aquaedulcis TaxID=2793270 RepID=A0A931H805_9BURK|nr:flavodoxin [Caenimonas aquaedulcis]MBG9390223.1 flavodoxin [Caenimonas aquaedulcis]